jgi:hypothetical protein
MALAQAPGPAPAGPSPRAAQRTLRAERAQLAHWRRLLRARLDLTVAGLAPPEELGTLSWDLLPEAVLELPRAEELRSAVTLPSIEDTVELMNRIRSLDRALGRYALRIDSLLEDATEHVVHDLAGGVPHDIVAPVFGATVTREAEQPTEHTPGPTATASC